MRERRPLETARRRVGEDHEAWVESHSGSCRQCRGREFTRIQHHSDRIRSEEIKRTTRPAEHCLGPANRTHACPAPDAPERPHFAVPSLRYLPKRANKL